MYMIAYSLEDFQDSLKIKDYDNYSNLQILININIRSWVFGLLLII